ncbi:hypothetical protein GCM10011390_50110 [Aureimonas endophytica]|uniref:DUF4384 domain-containing protein n=1 Tax=Aureimonas endophytica TaxID=2027858 RepID=A0A917ED14_9HYPH|nr:DUF4384 domain-containing protein [Aureimonas endophytica]GGE24652.1 hypothetical protein GCM10011390_50110 [Aureimonas endophytica]
MVSPEPSHKPTAQGKPVTPTGQARMVVSLVPSGSTVLPVGAPYRFTIVASQPSYGHVYVASASGKVQVWAENIRLASGKPVSMPPSGLRIVASAPAGDDTIYFYATRDRFSRGFFKGTTVRKPADLQLTEAQFRSAMAERLAAQSKQGWASTTQVIRVTD